MYRKVFPQKCFIYSILRPFLLNYFHIILSFNSKGNKMSGQSLLKAPFELRHSSLHLSVYIINKNRSVSGFTGKSNNEAASYLQLFFIFE